MSGAMSFDELKEKTKNGEIDTVLSCIVDMQGRLAGKRFHAAHFVNSAWKETHAAITYLQRISKWRHPMGIAPPLGKKDTGTILCGLIFRRSGRCLGWKAP